jgi:hypothetical protein
LNVPVTLQPDNLPWCVPACLMMAIDYLNSNKLKDPISGLSMTDLARMMKTRFGGTHMNYVQLINDDERVLAAAPSVEFDAALQPREFENIVEDLKSELPVIAWSSLGSNDDEAPHAVIVTGVSTSREEITYNCPVRGRRTTPSKPFLDTWYHRDKLLIRIKLGKRDIRKMDQYLTGVAST